MEQHGDDSFLSQEYVIPRPQNDAHKSRITSVSKSDGITCRERKNEFIKIARVSHVKHVQHFAPLYDHVCHPSRSRYKSECGRWNWNGKIQNVGAGEIR